MALTVSEKANIGIFQEECDDTTGNIFIAGKHSISENEYNKMIYSFFGSAPYSHKVSVFTPQELGLSCITNCIGFTFRPDIISNNDIFVDVVGYPQPDNPSFSVVGKYSIHLFRGLETLYNPAAYHFCKARKVYDGEIIVTLVLAAVDSNGNPLYYGDLTNMYP